MAHASPSPLISTTQLAAELGSPGLAVVDASWHLPELKRDARAEFEAGHIPGAVYLDIDVVADQGHALGHMLPDAPTFAREVGKLGLGNDRRIVVYDTRGLYSAARVWWMFRIYGHDDVRVLDGGYVKWLAEKRPVEAGPATPKPSVFAPRAPRMELVRSAEDVRANLTARAAQVADARTPGRFTGTEPDPYPGVRSGRIPGSVNVHWAGLLDPQDKTLLPPAEIADRFRKAGLDLDRPMILSCGSGVTACILALGLHVAGKDDWSVYDGSWDEWGRREDLPIET
jgi:thiosulfate/3-mercaptopyruvate sulfurtransferase